MVQLAVIILSLPKTPRRGRQGVFLKKSNKNRPTWISHMTAQRAMLGFL
jgi:hypothetical protein